MSKPSWDEFIPGFVVGCAATSLLYVIVNLIGRWLL